MYQQNKSESKVKFRQASNLCKRVLQSARLAYATKTKGSVPSHKLIKIKSGSDCIPVVVLKNCEPELSYKLAELFSVCLKESCFPNCWKVSSVVPVFKSVGERSTAKN